jgi:hypothetical protein
MYAAILAEPCQELSRIRLAKLAEQVQARGLHGCVGANSAGGGGGSGACVRASLQRSPSRQQTAHTSHTTTTGLLRGSC